MIFLGNFICILGRLGVLISNRLAAAKARASALKVSPNWAITWLNISGENAEQDVGVYVVSKQHGKHQKIIFLTILEYSMSTTKRALFVGVYFLDVYKEPLYCMCDS